MDNPVVQILTVFLVFAIIQGNVALVLLGIYAKMRTAHTIISVCQEFALSELVLHM
jgi:hypothetical protein